MKFREALKRMHKGRKMEETLTPAIVALCVLLLMQSVQANLLTFDELPRQSVDDLNFNGVTFDFKINGLDSYEAEYNVNTGPGNITYIQDSFMEGNTSGILTLVFDVPVNQIKFGVALDSYEELTPGFTVELFDVSLVSMSTVSVNTLPLISFSEGQFDYIGSPVKQICLDFAHRHESIYLFAMDNLYFNPVPEPATLLLFGLGGLVLQKRRK